MDEQDPIPYGYCHCGCGQKTNQVKGAPNRYIHGHWNRSTVEKVMQGYRVDEATGCWVWQRAHMPQGYGNATDPRTGKKGKAYRIIYEHLIGPIPDGLHLDHLCRNPACVNPAHLEPVTCTGSVNWKRDRKKWRARIYRDSREIHLGYFGTEEDAWLAIREALAGD